VTAASVAGLFARNERVVCCFEGERVPFAIVLVGALFVGSMGTVWHGDVSPRRPRRPTPLPLENAAASLTLSKGAEMGRFNMGSTVILLFPPRAVAWRDGLAAGDIVRMGRPIGQLCE
jgi:phosphatidylserine decarboxylase